VIWDERNKCWMGRGQCLTGQCRGAPQQESLAIRNAQVADDSQIGRALDALCNQLGAAGSCKRGHRFHCLEFQWIERDVVDEKAVDFHVPGCKPYPEIHVRIRAAVVVERERGPACAQCTNGRVETIKVGNDTLLRQFDYDALSAERAGAEQTGDAVACAKARFYHCGACVDEQQAGAMEARKGLATYLCRGYLQPVCRPFLLRLCKQAARRLEPGVRRTADEPFMPRNLSIGKVHDRLEYRPQRTVGNQRVDLRWRAVCDMEGRELHGNPVELIGLTARHWTS
jgi:hypothetical protein